MFYDFNFNNFDHRFLNQRMPFKRYLGSARLLSMLPEQATSFERRLAHHHYQRVADTLRAANVCLRYQKRGAMRESNDDCCPDIDNLCSQFIYSNNKEYREYCQ